MHKHKINKSVIHFYIITYIMITLDTVYQSIK